LAEGGDIEPLTATNRHAGFQNQLKHLLPHLP